jgi:LemA protein
MRHRRTRAGGSDRGARPHFIQLTPELINDPAAFAKFQAAQGELTQALRA